MQDSQTGKDDSAPTQGKLHAIGRFVTAKVRNANSDENWRQDIAAKTQKTSECGIGTATYWTRKTQVHRKTDDDSEQDKCDR